MPGWIALLSTIVSPDAIKRRFSSFEKASCASCEGDNVRVRGCTAQEQQPAPQRAPHIYTVVAGCGGRGTPLPCRNARPSSARFRR
eukprot:2452253-Prymnesium_polylepis.1